MFVGDVLLVYHHPPSASAPTIMEHVEAFERYSQFKVWNVNTAYGFPKGLRELRFAAIVLHYSPFGSYPFLLPEEFRRYIERSDSSVKVAFFQDEHRFCQERFALIDRLGIDVIYSLLHSQYFEEVYYRNTHVKQVLPTLTGYVCDNLINKAAQYCKPYDERDIDVGYRARPLAFYMGRGAQEKTEIARGFLHHSEGRGLRLDIKTSESERIYGDDWYRFVGKCRFMLGVEAGTSIFDIDGSVRGNVERFLEVAPNASFDEVEERILKPYEDRIHYRTISPRIFEAAALRTGLILFEGAYQGILKPFEHYLPLNKDFSNIMQVLDAINDRDAVSHMVGSVYRDVIAYNMFHYSRFIAEFDSMLRAHDIAGVASSEHAEADQIRSILDRDVRRRMFVVKLKGLKYKQFPGRSYVKRLVYRLGVKAGQAV